MQIEVLGGDAFCHLEDEDVLTVLDCLRVKRHALGVPEFYAEGSDERAYAELEVESLELVLADRFVVVSLPPNGGEVLFDDHGWALNGAIYNHDTQGYVQWYDALAPWILPLEPRR